MTKEGVMPESIRSDINKFAEFFESKIGDYFEITLVPNRSGKRNMIGSIRPLTEAEVSSVSDQVPF